MHYERHVPSHLGRGRDYAETQKKPRPHEGGRGRVYSHLTLTLLAPYSHLLRRGFCPLNLNRQLGHSIS